MAEEGEEAGEPGTPLVAAAAGGNRPGGNEGRPIELNTSGATMRSRSIPCWIYGRKRNEAAKRGTALSDEFGDRELSFPAPVPNLNQGQLKNGLKC